jgi:hypothetical protein
MKLTPLTREQAAVLTLRCDVICGPVDDALALASRLIGRPVALHELGTGEVSDEIRRLVEPVFVAMAPNAAMPEPVWPGDPSPSTEESGRNYG